MKLLYAILLPSASFVFSITSETKATSTPFVDEIIDCSFATVSLRIQTIKFTHIHKQPDLATNFKLHKYCYMWKSSQLHVSQQPIAQPLGQPCHNLFHRCHKILFVVDLIMFTTNSRLLEQNKLLTRTLLVRRVITNNALYSGADCKCMGPWGNTT